MESQSEKKSVLYISYGSGSHEKEVAFSLWSIKHRNRDRLGIDFLVYTDRPTSFEGLPLAEVVTIPTETWKDWGGPYHFNHRKKILALQHAMARRDGSIVLLDADTWLRQPISRLFGRIGPGHSVMHIREGSIGSIDGLRTAELRDLLDCSVVNLASGDQVQLSSIIDMWNAGVIGLHQSDRALLDDVLAITDQLCERSDLHVLEQFAFSWVLSHRTVLKEAADIVFHYWPPYLHKPFLARIEDLMSHANELPEAERAAFLYYYRPRPTMLRRGKVVLKRSAQLLGLIQGRARTNEW